ncbi:MAG: hypothetical protein ISR84_00940 [Kiritimatiellales bacterium]|nr:hypothetical protein [Kiritimatiellales bacterium]
MTAEKLDQTALLEELEQFRKEKERIRMLVGQIGGKHSQKKDNLINIVFIIAMVALFFLDLMRHLFHINMPLPQMFSIELAVLLVSIKIIWMIHRGTKVEHFQFWVLNSIEFRLNDVAKRLREIDKKLSAE